MFDDEKKIIKKMIKKHLPTNLNFKRLIFININKSDIKTEVN